MGASAAATNELALHRHGTSHAHELRRLATQRFVRQPPGDGRTRRSPCSLLLISDLRAVARAAPLLLFRPLAIANEFPSRAPLLGTDAIGHDFLSRMIYGMRTSLLVGFVAVLISCCIGMPLGLISGLRGGLTISSSCASSM